MKCYIKPFAGLFILSALAGAASAQHAISGTLDSNFYGSPLAIQNTQTQFGDSNLGMIDVANGSEADGIYAKNDGTYLYVFLTGNLESNFNKLELFIDCQTGGHNRLLGGYPDVDFHALDRMSDEGTGNGLRFDTGFDADYWFGMTCGGGTFALYANFSEVKKVVDGGVGYYLGQGNAATDGTVTGGNNPNDVRCTINNSNTAGVVAGTDFVAGGGAGVTTGVEWRIPLVQIGNPTGAIKICTFINGGGHDFLSNQVLEGMGGGSNLGEPRAVDFSIVPNNQYVTLGGGSSTVAPTSFTVFRGVQESGNLASLAASDDNYLVVRNGVTALRTESPVTVIVDATSPTQTASALTSKVENHVSITGLTQRIDLFDFVAGSYELEDTRTATTTDSVVTVNGASPNRFIQTGTKAIRSRVRVRADGPIFTSTWRSFLDQTIWTITP